MVEVSLEAHKSLIIRLHDEKLPEGQIVKRLKSIGVHADIFDIYHHLEKWHIIPTPSPVVSLEVDTDDLPERDRSAHVDQLQVECHHGPDSHRSQINLSSLPTGSTPLERYQQDYQAHEKRAFDWRKEEEEDLTALDVVALADTDQDPDELAAVLRHHMRTTKSKQNLSKHRVLRRHRVKRRK